MERSYGLGLRAQVIIALTAAFVLTFSALGLIVLQVMRSALEVERTRRARAMAEALSTSWELGSPRGADRVRSLAALVGHGDLIGAALEAPAGAAIQLGDTRDKATARVTLATGERLSLHLASTDAGAPLPLSGLLRLYLVLSGCLILLMTYVTLTRLIVRPVEELTAAAGRIAGGNLAARVPIAGAADVARLAVSFNRMADELRRDKAALEQRLKELERAGAELRTAQDQVIRGEKLASVGRLAAGVAHEIGNPLAAIAGLSELLQMGGSSEAEAREFSGRIRAETERIHGIIRGLLDYSRAQPPHDAAPQQADLATAVEHAVKLVAPQKDLGRITIERRFHTAHTRVRAPSDELTQILLNLLLNAADAVHGDGWILIEVSREGADARVVVSDSGPGISPEIEGRLFEPFATTKPVGKGTGLGLAVCHALVERMHGSIHAENAPAGGARFVVTLPALDSS